jgi:small GTP-binding protein
VQNVHSQLGFFEEFHLKHIVGNSVTSIFPKNGRFEELEIGSKYWVSPRKPLATQSSFIPYETLQILPSSLGSKPGELTLANWCGKMVIVKMLDDEHANESEISALCNLSHPNIAKSFGWSKNHHLHRDCIILQWLPLGNLREAFIEKMIIDWPLLFRYSLDIVRGLEYLHHLNMVGELTLEKIMLDVGAVDESPSSKNKQLQKCRLVNFQFPSKTKLASSANVIAFGLVFYSLLTSQDPWDGCGEFPENRLSSLIIPEWVPEPLIELLEQCWQVEPEKRPSLVDIENQLLACKTSIIESKRSLFVLCGKHIQGIENFAVARMIPLLGLVKVSLVYSAQGNNVGVALSVQGNCVYWQESLIPIPREKEQQPSSWPKHYAISLDRSVIVKILQIGLETLPLFEIASTSGLDQAQIILKLTSVDFKWLELEPEYDPPPVAFRYTSGRIELDIRLAPVFQQSIEIASLTQANHDVQDFESHLMGECVALPRSPNSNPSSIPNPPSNAKLRQVPVKINYNKPKEKSLPVLDPDTTDNHEFLMKILLIGDINVGKSSLIIRYTEEQFYQIPPSQGIDSFTKLIRFPKPELNTHPSNLLTHPSMEANESCQVKIQLWDTAGQERFSSFTNSFYRGAHGVIIVFDISAPSSAQSVKEWYERVRMNSLEHISIAIVGNKIDLESHSQDSLEIAQAFANELQLPYFETSAKTSQGVENMFSSVAYHILCKHFPMWETQKKSSSMKSPPVNVLRPESSPSLEGNNECC